VKAPTVTNTSFCVTGSGAFLTILADNVETTVRLPNGMKRVARDLADLADAAESKARDELRRATRLRAAIEYMAKAVQV
jgi:hypothetical protein